MNNYDIHYGAKQHIIEKAKELRKRETAAEKILWNNLRDRKLKGYKFRRQHPIDCFIADFYCHKLKLVIEIDGGIHDLPENQEYDIGRTNELNNYNIKVVRFNNKQIKESIEDVLKAIKTELDLRQGEIKSSP